ncbi:unnamed protein product [Toxocara canis]|uniref:EB domain-containing protein n=1 Tax=Toxocara canis TaxID=6265 RepID=A0A183UJU3_TOXCA|nr:unnamed protein product [Toxocara canis]
MSCSVISISTDASEVGCVKQSVGKEARHFDEAASFDESRSCLGAPIWTREQRPAAFPFESSSRVEKQLFPEKRAGNVMQLTALLLSLLSTISALAQAIKCYCTDDHCVPYGVCESTVCLVGILKSSNSVIRTCGSELIGCRRDVGRWLDLCACDKPLCNTFSYLRSNTRKEAEPPDGDSLVFNRVDRWVVIHHAPENCILNISKTPFKTHIDTNPSYPEPDAPLSTRTSFLTILLVGVPLAVGTATVVVVAFNYYCHLC